MAEADRGTVKRAIGLLRAGAEVAARVARARLARRQPHSAARPDAGTAAAAPRRPHLLVVSPYSIHPMIHGGAVRIGNLVRRIAAHADVSLLVFVGGTDDPEQRKALEPFCRRVLFQRTPDLDPKAIDPWGLLPPSAARYAGPVVDDRLAALVDAHSIDVVLLEYTEMGRLANPSAPARVALVEHDLSFRSHARQRSVGIHHRPEARDILGRGAADWLRRYRFELAACARADQIHVMSDADGRELARRLGDGARRIRIIPNGVDTGHFRPPTDDAARTGVLFVGSFPHLPNQDAFDHLLRDIWPQVRRRLPDATLTVAGARPPRRVLELDGRDGIAVAGEVPDLAPLYRTHRVLAVPIRAGSGTRLKILEAMASGLPVVSTTVGAEGIEAEAGEHLLIADDPSSFAEALAKLLEDHELGARLAAAGRRLAVERYDWDRVAELLRAAIGELAPATTHRVAVEQVGGATPLVSVLIPVRPGGEPLERCLSGVADQRFAGGVEVLCVGGDLSEADRRSIGRHGARLVARPAGADSLGQAINAGARAASGRVLVLLAADAVPADGSWLERLVAPLLAAAAPAAVQGGLHIQFVDGGPPYDPGFTAETRSWRDRMGGFALSTANMAIRRDAWERFPAPSGGLTGPRWQRMLTANDELVLPCWAASVRCVRPLDPAQTVRAAWQEGRQWRRLGVRYRLGELLQDLLGAGSPAGSSGESASSPSSATRTHRLHRVLRPPALYLGNLLRGIGV